MSYTPYNFDNQNKQQGYSLVEWMIAIFLTLFLISGLLTVFVSSKRATDEALGSSERLENATFALQLLVKDLKQAYFFAQATGENKSLWELNGASIAASLDCLDEVSSGTFPNAGVHRQLWAAIVPTTLIDVDMACINDNDNQTSLIANSAYIDVKRARGLSESSNFLSDHYYLAINPSGIKVYPGDSSELSGGSVSPVWQYIRHVYYLDQQDNIPRLRRLRLQKNAMVREEVLVEGIENMQFMFALDNLIPSDRDGAIHAFVSANKVTASDWDTGRVIGMKIYLLARSLNTTPGYVNNDVYQLGETFFTAPGDAFKRELVSHVLTFQNSVVLIDD